MSDSITLISTGATGQGINGAIMPSISADGTKVAFSSDSSTLVAGDTNNRFDVFFKDLTTGALTLVSTGANGQGNDASVDPSISGNGTKVAFDSTASNLVPGDANRAGDVFVKDVITGTLMPVSTGANGLGNGGSFKPSISADGTKVAFYSSASNLVAGDTNNRNDIFVKNLATGVVTLVTTGAGGQGDSDSFDPSISADGTKVAFYSFASNLVAGETDIGGNVFVKDLTTGVVTRVTIPIDGGQPDGLSFAPSISADGTKVAFSSSASNLVTDDTNGKDDVFFKNLTTGVLTRVSTGVNGEGDDHSYVPSIFPDGSKVAFSSDASNLVAGGTNGERELYIKDVATGALTLFSTGANGPANGEAYRSSVSADGTRIAFESAASNLVAGDTNGIRDVFVKGPTTNTVSMGTTTTLGPATGPDTLVLSLSQDAYLGNAQYDVAMDGTKLNDAPLTINAASLHGSATSDTVNIKGSFARGAHNVTVTFLNDQYAGTAATDRNLYVNNATYADDAVTGGPVLLANSSAALLSTGSQAAIGFNDVSPASSQISTTTLGTGAHRLTFQVEQDPYQGSAQYDVRVDGTKLNTTPITASALRGSGQRDLVTLFGDFTAGVKHTLTVDFLNDKYDGTAQTDRNLYVSGTTYDGAVVANGTLALLSQGPQTITF